MHTCTFEILKILTAICWIAVGWKKLDAQRISRCFKHCPESNTNYQYVQDTRAAPTKQFMDDVAQH